MQFFPDPQTFLAFKLGSLSFSIRWYAVLIMTGALLAYYVSRKDVRKARYIDGEFFDSFFVYTLWAGIIGARIWFCVFYNFSYYLSDPIEIIRVWDGGLAIQGGIVFGAVFACWYAKKNRYSFLKLLDIALPNVLIGQGIGRWGNFVNKECHGGEVSEEFFNGILSFLKDGMYINSHYYEPLFFYESLLCLFGWALIHFVLKKYQNKRGDLAYAYLMYRRDRNLSEVAEKRLRAIRDFTEFGSGFRIAMKDLELRGAGNILGTEQSGHMLNVGYELYCKLLEEAVDRLQGRQVLPQAEETTFSLSIPALIPQYYIEDEVLRLQMYKKIAMITGEEDQSDVIDEMLDRFGDIPKDTMNLIRISKIRSQASRLGVREISQNGYKLMMKLWETTRFAEGVIPRLAAAYGDRIRFGGGSDPWIRVTVSAADNDKVALEELEKFFRTALSEQKLS